MDPNPYESPKTEQPLNRVQRLKRGIGLAAILLLTPPAMIIAVLTCCSAPFWFPATPPLIVVVVPFALLTGLMGWAAYVSWPRKDAPNSGKGPVGILLWTPVCVAVAGVLGFGLAALAYAGIGEGDDFIRGESLVLPAFWLPPAVTLLVMLWLAWRHR